MNAESAPLPHHGVNWWRRGISRIWLRVTGWKVVGQPPGPRLVLIAAPHTTNWDLPYTLAAAWALGMPIRWMGKKSLFRQPFGTFLKRLGGIPVDRSASRGVVGQIVARFAESDRLVVVVPPAATRSKAEHWRSGFYWIALQAKVPIVCAFLDYGRKTGGVGLSFIPTGDVRADMDRIREFYRGIEGRHPENITPMRLREEDEEQTQG